MIFCQLLKNSLKNVLKLQKIMSKNDLKNEKKSPKMKNKNELITYIRMLLNNIFSKESII